MKRALLAAALGLGGLLAALIMVLILIGMYAAAAHISREEILSMEGFAARNGKYAVGTVMDSTYSHLPVRNVMNTDIGMRLMTSGAISGN